MNFINNWRQDVILSAGATSLALDLPDGSYILSLADSLSQATRWEIVAAEVAAGTATLTRAQEGTADQDWPDGSVIYCSLTAGGLTGLFASIASLEARLLALETPPQVWNSDHQMGMDLSSDALTAIADGSGFSSIWALRAATAKRYFEVTVVGTSGNSWVIGLSPEDEVPDYNYGNGVGMRALDGAILEGDGAVNTTAGQEYGVGDTLRFAFDAGTGSVWIAVNAGGWINGGSPDSGTTPTVTTTKTNLCPYAMIDGASGSILGRFAAADLLYDVPAGFSVF